MADNRSFFAKVFGAPQQPPQQQGPQYAVPYQPMFPGAIPPGHQPAPLPQPGQYYPQQPGPPQYDGRQVMAALKAGQITQQQALEMGLANPKPFDTARAGETELCPNCGDNRYFTRYHLRDKRTRMAPAPLCMSCGYAGDMFNGAGHGTVGEQYVDPSLPEAN